MAHPDLNLLVTLDALLTEGSVAKAAARLGITPSAASRALSRLRTVTGDPLLVRAGRGLVPTPRAVELSGRTSSVIEAAASILTPQTEIDPLSIERTFVLRSGEGFIESFGAALFDLLQHQAPSARLQFIPKTERSSEALRSGIADFETGVLESAKGPELRVKALYKDHFVGVVREGHPFVGKTVTRADYLASKHVVTKRFGMLAGPVCNALSQQGEARREEVAVGSFAEALSLVRDTDLTATVPAVSTVRLRAGLSSFPVPIAIPAITVALVWHPRMDNDPAHRWLRDKIFKLCSSQVRSFENESDSATH